jgi:tRNA uridine 5-carboxymethylaminomethyl modification enzyme
MFTSRAEYRLLLRQDNADLRLRKRGYEVGLISQQQYEAVIHKEKAIEREQERLKKIFRTINGRSCSLAQLLARPEITYGDLLSLCPHECVDYGADTNTQIEVAIKYAGYIQRQLAEVEKLRVVESVALPKNFDYYAVNGLRTEARSRLQKTLPTNLGQASRIPGIAPADISVLMVALHR